MKILSNELKQFLTEWHYWAKQGAITTKFRREWGLCSNLDDWALIHNGISEQKSIELYQELRDAHAEYTGHNGAFPFGGSELYFDEFDARIAHLNKQRLDFVQNILEDNSK